MSASESTSSLPHRRRSSILSRARPRTAVTDYNMENRLSAQPNMRFAFGQGSYEPERHRYSQWLERPEALETSDYIQNFDSTPLPQDTVPTHRTSKSFTNLRHGVEELRSVVRRMSISFRNKTPNQASRTQRDAISEDVKTGIFSPTEQRSESKSKASGWFRSPRNRRRPSLNLLRPQPDFPPPKYSLTSPVPGSRLEPPILPDNLSGGAAARAAAAAQNELWGAGRVVVSKGDMITKGDPRLWELKLTRDSESGIGIDLRDRSDSADSDVAVVRKDPLGCLPPEIMAQILSYLDPDSLMHSELVSHVWNKAASSHHVWRHVFRQEYGRRQPKAVVPAGKASATGMGKTRPDQDWKKMFLVRKALENRWADGKAAAIYLNGHKDSVYCVQFDENKIITGSRDQTIRIWDAHTYQCIKVIGAPPLTTPATGAVLTTHHNTQSPGRLPFASITPPSGIAPPPNSSTPSDYHRASILCLQFDSEIMVTGSSDFSCIVWDVTDDYRPIRRLRGHTAGVLDVCFDSQYIISCSKDTTICVWNRSDGELLKKLTGHRGPVNAVQLRGDLIVSASGDGIAKLWNLKSGLCIKEFPSKDRGLACVEFSHDARTILAGGNDQVIYQFDANTGELVNELKGHKGLVRSLHLDSVNGRVVSGSYDMSVKVFDAESGDLVIDFPGWTTSWMLSAKSDYRRIIATSQDSRAVIMDFGWGLEDVALLEG